MVITNNPMVKNHLEKNHNNLLWVEGSYEDVLLEVRNKVHLGHHIISHPLAGSIKPYETPYRTVVISDKAEALHMQSLETLEQVFALLNSFKGKDGKLHSLRTYREDDLPDLQLIDLDLIKPVMCKSEESL
ncbi:MAG: GrdX protein [Tindallia sp. MSAO_Bac2]|nr:MAG: GrdX protein [Tindallia sp. MSAO_Bac2]